MKALRTAAGKKQGRLKRKGPDGFLAESWDKREQRTGARGVNSWRRFLCTDMSLAGEIKKLLDLGDHEQEEAWGERVMVDGQECRGVFAPLEGWYEVELGGRG